MSRFIDNLDYFEKRYKQELKDCDYLDLCDRKFGWRDGATAALINKAGKRKTTRLYKSRYLVFDAKDESKYEI